MLTSQTKHSLSLSLSVAYLSIKPLSQFASILCRHPLLLFISFKGNNPLWANCAYTGPNISTLEKWIMKVNKYTALGLCKRIMIRLSPLNSLQ